MARQLSATLTLDALRKRLEPPPPQEPGKKRLMKSGPPIAARKIDVTVDAADSQLIRDWLTQLHRLKGVPFNYLVADIAMLPAESLRFFQVDKPWIDAMLDGAFSLGAAGVAPAATQQARQMFSDQAQEQARTSGARQAMREEQYSHVAASDTQGNTKGNASDTSVRKSLSGFLLRSTLLNSWPGLEVQGFDSLQSDKALAIVRMERVAPGVLMCLFAGLVKKVCFTTPGEAVHFGVAEAGNDIVRKHLRRLESDNPKDIGTFTGASAEVGFRPGGRRVMPLAGLAANMARSVGKPLTAASFALQMVESVDKVTFRWSDS